MLVLIQDCVHRGLVPVELGLGLLEHAAFVDQPSFKALNVQHLLSTFALQDLVSLHKLAYGDVRVLRIYNYMIL